MSPDEPKTGLEKRTDAFLSKVQQRHRQREKNERDKSFWASVGTMGTVGWSVSLPTALGVLLGRWLDGRMDSGYVFMVFFMLVGLVTGCVIAWRTISEKM